MAYSNQKCVLLLLITAFLQTGAHAAQDLYKIVDENGNVTYTDSPKGNNSAEKVDLRTTNTQPATKFTTPVKKNTERSPNTSTQYSLSISSPANDTHLTPGQWDLTVTTSIEPALKKDHYIQLFDNNTAVSPTQKETTFTIQNIIRGSHKLQVKIVTKQGNTIKSSNAINVYVHRVNVN